MGPIAATFLCYYQPERAYAALVRLHDAYNLHAIFSPGFPGLLEAIYVQERITERLMPQVYKAFKEHMISTTAYATKWYITLFANTVPFQTQLRIWDVFFIDGQDLFVAVAVAIVWVFKGMCLFFASLGQEGFNYSLDQIVSKAANFETILSLLSSYFVPEDDNAFLSWIEMMLGDKKLRSAMTTWRKEWKSLVESGKDADVLL